VKHRIRSHGRTGRPRNRRLLWTWHGLVAAIVITSGCAREDISVRSSDPWGDILGVWQTPEDPQGYLDTEWGPMRIVLEFRAPHQLTRYVLVPDDPEPYWVAQGTYDVQTRLIEADFLGDAPVPFAIDDAGRLILSLGDTEPMILVRSAGSTGSQ